MRQLVYAMVITNNHASLHLRWKENLLEYQYVSKYDEHGCLENFLWSFMSLLTVLFVKNSHILAGIYFIVLKKLPRRNLKGLQTKFGPLWKCKTNFSTFLQIRCSNFRLKLCHVRQILALSCKFVVLILGWNCVKALELQRLSEKFKFERSGAS